VVDVDTHWTLSAPPVAHRNQRKEWDAGILFDFENPEYRS
jgi:hypothetical protein